jgi:hypothetical protein
VSYAVRLRLRDAVAPPAEQPPVELPYLEVAEKRGSLAWCNELAERIRGLARELRPASRRSLERA